MKFGFPWLLPNPLFHGGVGGLEVGDHILPPSVTSTEGPMKRNADVYMNTHVEIARQYATRSPHGRVYEVEPDGDAIVVGKHWGKIDGVWRDNVVVTAPAAKIVRVVETVPLTPFTAHLKRRMAQLAAQDDADDRLHASGGMRMRSKVRPASDRPGKGS